MAIRLAFAILEAEDRMRRWEYEIVTIKPKWSPVKLVLKNRTEQNKTSIIRQLNEEYIAKGWHIADEIYWERDHRFAVLKIRRAMPTLFDQIFESSSTR